MSGLFSNLFFVLYSVTDSSKVFSVCDRQGYYTCVMFGSIWYIVCGVYFIGETGASCSTSNL